MIKTINYFWYVCSFGLALLPTAFATSTLYTDN